MRRLFSAKGGLLRLLLPLGFSLGVSCGASLGLCSTAAASDFDPPRKHYTASRMPADAGLVDKKPMGHYRGFLRPAIDLTSLMPPVGDQGELSSGIAWAVAYAARSYYAGRNENRNIESPENEASPSYVYSLARRGRCADGATISNAVEVLRQGALSLAAYPYSADCRDPAAAADAAGARDFRVSDYRVLDRSQIDDVKSQLNRGNPVVVVFRVSPAFEDLRGEEVFKEVDFAQAGGEDLWQPLTIVGYDETRGAVRVMNSWGRGWGDDGYAWVSYEAMTNRISGAVVLDVLASGYQQAETHLPEAIAPPAQPPALTPPKAAEPTADMTASEADHAQDDAVHDDQKAQDDTAAGEHSEAHETPAETPKRKPTLADLEALSCAKIDQTRSNGSVTLSGFVSGDDDLAKVREIAAREPGYALGKVVVVPWPQCEALGTLDKALKSVTIRPVLETSPSDIARLGDTLRVDLRTPSRPSYVYLSYFTADEKVITLVQPRGKIMQPTGAGLHEVFGDGTEGRSKFTVSEPLGNEMMIAIASASPLFDSELPKVQTERDFLSALRHALVYKPSSNLPDREVGAAIQVLRTQAQ